MATVYSYWFTEQYRSQMVGKDAKAVGATLVALAKKEKGEFSVDVVLAQARPASSPLHPLFEWDEQRAAEAHRKAQARDLLTNIRITQVVKDEHVQTPVAVKVHTITFSHLVEKQRFRVEIADSKTDESTRVFQGSAKGALEKAVEELEKFRLRFARLTELSPVITSIDDFLRTRTQLKAA